MSRTQVQENLMLIKSIFVLSSILNTHYLLFPQYKIRSDNLLVKIKISPIRPVRSITVCIRDIDSIDITKTN